jgi:hypothetical protein
MKQRRKFLKMVGCTAPYRSQFNLNANNDKVLRNTAVPNKINLREKTVQVSCERINYLPICTKYHKLILLQMIRANFDLKFPLQIDFQEDNLEAKQQENF